MTTLTNVNEETVTGTGTQFTVVSGISPGLVVVETVTDTPETTVVGTIIDGGLMEVALGGTAIDTTINSDVSDIYPAGSGGEQILYVSGVASSTIINSGALQFLSGGSANSTTIESGGLQTVADGYQIIGGGIVVSTGVANTTEIKSGSQQDVYFGGVAVNTTVDSGGVQYVFGGSIEPILSEEQGFSVGTASGTTIDSGGYQIVVGGSVTSTTIESGGQEIVSASGTDTDTTVDALGLQLVTSGGSATHTTFDEAGLQEVISGGSATSATLSGVGLVHLGGITISETIDSGGTLFDEFDGMASGTVVNSGGTLNVYDGATLSGATVDNGTLNFNLSGSQTFSGTLTGSGSLLVSRGGTLVMSGGDAFTGSTTIGGPNFASVGSGSTLELSSAGAAGTGPITFAPGANGILKIDGATMPTNVISGLAPYIPSDPNSAGTAPFTADTIDLSGVPYSSLGIATLSSSKVLTVSEGGSSYSLKLDPNQDFTGEVFPLSSDGQGGTDVQLIKKNPAAGFDVGSWPSNGTNVMNALWNNTNLSSVLFYLSPAPDRPQWSTLASWMGQNIRGTLAGQGWNVIPVFEGAQQNFTGIPDANGHVFLPPSIAGAAADAFTAQSELRSEGFAPGITVYLAIETPGALSPAELNYIGTWCSDVAAFGYKPGVYCFASQPTQILPFVSTSTTFWITHNTITVPNGANIIPTPDPSGSGYAFANAWQYQINNYNFAALSGTDLDSIKAHPSSTLTIAAGQTVSNSTVSDNNSLNILSGGTATGTVINGGGTENVSGSDVGGTVNDGGYQYILAGGTTTGTVVNDPGVQVIFFGGTATDTTLNGGEQGVYGLAIGTAIDSGGFEDVFSGGIARATTINGGTMELMSGGSAGSGPITFKSTGGTLKVDGTTMPTNVISGFALGDTLDLAGVDFSSAGTAALTSGNLLQVVENGQTYNLRFDSSQSFAGKSFELSSDGNGGTNIDLAPAVLDDDTNEQAALRLTVDNSSSKPIGAAGTSNVPFTLAGLDLEDSGTVTFTDANGKTAKVGVNGGQNSYSANLSKLGDGPITSSLALNTDPAGNSFMPVAGNTITLDQDLNGPEAPVFTISKHSITVPAGDSVALPIKVSADSDDNVLVTISGVPQGFENITANDGNQPVTHHGANYTFTEADVNSGLTLRSTYKGGGHPVNTFTVTASNTVAGEAATSAAQTLTVTDPPATLAGNLSAPISIVPSAPAGHLGALFDQFAAAGFHSDHAAAGQIASLSGGQNAPESLPLFLGAAHRG